MKLPIIFANCIMFSLSFNAAILELAVTSKLAIPNLPTTITVIFVKFIVIPDSSEDGVPQCHRKC